MREVRLKRADPASKLPAQRSSGAPRDASPDSVVMTAELLLREYGPYPDESDQELIQQLLWFMLSTRTTVENCEAAYRALNRDFLELDIMADAPEEALYEGLRPAGLYRSRARNIQGALRRIRDLFGRITLESLRSMGDEEAEKVLLSLPGVGLKVARCVLSFGMGRHVFAVATHIWRVSRRLGWHSFPAQAPTGQGAQALQDLIPSEVDATSLHVNLIRLGRAFCTTERPRCGACPLAAICPAA